MFLNAGNFRALCPFNQSRGISALLTSLTLLLALQVPAFGQASSLSSRERALAGNVSVTQIKKITKKLASDGFEGRGMLQPGGEKAARWMAGQMKSIGLKPLGDNGTYLQAAPFVESIVSPESTFKVGDETFEYGKDWSGFGLLADQSGEAPLVFVGHGIVSKALKRDDLKGFDLTGKWIVVIQGRPSTLDGSQWTNQVFGANVGSLIQRGAKGVVIVSNGLEDMSRTLLLDATSRRNVSTPEAAKAGVGLPLILVSEKAAARIFNGTGSNFREAVLKAERDDFKPIALGKDASLVIRNKTRNGNAHNVIGYFEGADPDLKKEAVVFTAHYDAFGIEGGRIFNGAADNAIGNGEMFAVARAFSQMDPKPRRSLIFISCMGEEYGLRGSRHWAANPTWDITKVAADLNLDGIGTEIMGPVKRMIGFGAKYSTLGTEFDSLIEAYGIQPMEDPIPEQGVFKRSDHYAFVERGIPALMLVGSPEESREGFVKVFNEFENTKYHQPSDDVYDSWQWSGAKTVADIMAIIGLRVAQADKMPAWKPNNEFSDLKRGDKIP